MIKKPAIAPERQYLADAIEARNAAKAKYDALQNAVGDWHSPARAAVRAAENKIEEATAAVAKATEDAAANLVAGHVGEAVTPVKTIAQARLEEQTARDELEAAQSAVFILKGQLGVAQSEYEFKEQRLKEAVSVTLQAAPEVDALVKNVERLQAELYAAGAVLLALSSHNGLDERSARSENDWQHPRHARIKNRLQQPPHIWQDLLASPKRQEWEAAIKALSTDASAALPKS
jgi:hypothetical protein